MRADEKEAQVFVDAYTALSHPELIRELSKRQHEEFSQQDETMMRLETITVTLARLPQDRERILDAYQEGTLEKAEMKSRLRQLAERREKLEAERGMLQSRGGEAWVQAERIALYSEAVSALQMAAPTLLKREGARRTALFAISGTDTRSEQRKWAIHSEDLVALPEVAFDVKHKVVLAVFDRIMHKPEGGSNYISTILDSGPNATPFEPFATTHRATR